MVEKLLAAAAAEIGTKENPPNSNRVKYNDWFYNKPVSGPEFAWCCIFVAWCFEHAGLSGIWLGGNIKETAYCPYVAESARKLGRWYTGGYKRGDVLLFDLGGTGGASHMGICETVKPGGTFVTIEGNTSQADNRGGSVMRRERKPSDVLGAYRPVYIEEDNLMEQLKDGTGMDDTEIFNAFRALKPSPKPDLPDKWADEAMRWAQNIGVIQGDESGDPMSHKNMTRQEFAVALKRFSDMINFGTEKVES